MKTFAKGQSTFTCTDCSKLTRDVDGNGPDVTLCSECYEVASLENAISDNGDEDGAMEARIQSIRVAQAQSKAKPSVAKKPRAPKGVVVQLHDAHVVTYKGAIKAAFSAAATALDAAVAAPVATPSAGKGAVPSAAPAAAEALYTMGPAPTLRAGTRKANVWAAMEAACPATRAQLIKAAEAAEQAWRSDTKRLEAAKPGAKWFRRFAPLPVQAATAEVA